MKVILISDVEAEISEAVSKHNMPLAENTFKHYLKDNQKELGITYSGNIPSENRKHVRGFYGIIVEINTDNIFPSYSSTKA